MEWAYYLIYCTVEWEIKPFILMRHPHYNLVDISFSLAVVSIPGDIQEEQSPLRAPKLHFVNAILAASQLTTQLFNL